MLFYSIIILIITIVFGLNKIAFVNSKKKQSKFCLILTAFILLIISTFRASSVGTDLHSYHNYFLAISQKSFIEIFTDATMTSEVGFDILCKIISLVSINFYSFNFFTSFIILFCVFTFIGIYSKNYYLSSLMFMLLFFLLSFNIVRQFISISICLLALSSLFKKKYLKFVILNLLAISFHSTAIIFLISILLFTFRERKEFVYIFVVFMVICLLFDNYLLAFFINLYDKEKLIYLTGFNGGLFTTFSILIMIIAIFMTDKKYITFKNLYIFFTLSALIINILSFNAPVMYRLILFFTIFQIIYVPSFIISKNNNHLDIAVKILIIMFYFALFYYTLYEDLSGVVPFKFFN